MVGKYEIEKFNESDFTLRNEKKSNEKKAEKIAANLYMLMGNTHQVGESSVASTSLGEESTMLWHRNLGHMSEQGLQILSKQKLLPGLNSVYLPFCEHCVTTKQHKFKFSTLENADAHADADNEELRTASAGTTSDENGNGEGWSEGMFLEVEAQFRMLGVLRVGPRLRATAEVLDDYRTIVGFAGIGEYGQSRVLGEKLKLDCVERFKEGELGLEQLALLDYINELLTNSLVQSNLSIFKSLPDWWAIGQMFPLMPIQQLNKRPTVRAVLSDLTCDSDGKLSRRHRSRRMWFQQSRWQKQRWCHLKVSDEVSVISGGCGTGNTSKLPRIGRISTTRFPRVCLAVFCGGVVFRRVGGRARPSGPPLVPPPLAEGQEEEGFSLCHRST